MRSSAPRRPDLAHRGGGRRFIVYCPIEKITALLTAYTAPSAPIAVGV
jgi:hypothetical protein